ncbi:hypothetical protein CLOSYM_02068 [[Clostridium] symbiosum ATCC 14940]|uniref:Uncharacterized protein n=1 Tax=[Clostridium] symbiosum ATCC 14940 TaxID=411472 RepID=A0ABC9TYK4_CLOSY|nr:hypothetical protein CLOSYM_02068 [[Clostridium] symbiosum ATCC 14940]
METFFCIIISSPLLNLLYKVLFLFVKYLIKSSYYTTLASVCLYKIFLHILLYKTNWRFN